MQQNLMRPLIVMSLLVASTHGVAAPPDSPQTVRQLVLGQTENTDQMLSDACTKSYPTLEASFHAALADHQRRTTLILNTLLETDTFKPLAQAEAPDEAIASYASSSAFMRTATFSLQDCNRILSDISNASDESLKGVLTQMLASIKGMVQMQKRSSVEQ